MPSILKWASLPEHALAPRDEPRDEVERVVDFILIHIFLFLYFLHICDFLFRRMASYTQIHADGSNHQSTHVPAQRRNSRFKINTEYFVPSEPCGREGWRIGLRPSYIQIDSLTPHAYSIAMTVFNGRRTPIRHLIG